VLERAADWLFSHADDLDAALAGVSESSASVAAAPAASGAGEGAGSFQDGNADYELVGFVSHMGSNTGYVPTNGYSPQCCIFTIVL
jgi:ubiquitin carboxyl-terminal hydrolase 5/13